MADCCPPNSFPALTLKDQVTSGTIVTHKTASFYSTGSLSDTTGRRAVIFIPDIFGWNSGRTRKIADHIAGQLKILVVVLKSLSSYKGGDDGPPEGYNFGDATDQADRAVWMKSISSWEGSLKGRVVDLFDYLESQKCTGVGLVGFCWGGWGTCEIAANFPTKVKCQAIPHPSMERVEQMLGRDPTDICRRSKCPTFLLPGGNDPDSYRSGGAMLKALQEGNAASKSSDHEFDAVTHGWVPRSDNPAEYPLVTKAVDMVTEFLKEHLFK